MSTRTPIAIATMNNGTIFKSYGITSVDNPSTGTYRTNFDQITQNFRTSIHDAAIICQAQTPTTSNSLLRILHKYEYHYSVQSYAQIGYRRVTGSGFGNFIAPGYHTIVVTSNQSTVLSNLFVIAACRFDTNGTLSSAQHGITSFTRTSTGIHVVNFQNGVTSNFSSPQTEMPILFQHYIPDGNNTVDQCRARNNNSITLWSITSGGTSLNGQGSVLVFNI